MIKAGNPDWVNIQYSIASYSNYHPMISFLPMFIKLWRLKCKTVITIHEITPPELFPGIPKFINWGFGLFCTTVFLAFTDRIIVCSNWVFGEMERKLAIFSKSLKNRIYFVPAGSNIVLEPPDKLAQTRLRSRYNIKEGDFIVCFFGFIRKGRDIETLIKAYKLLLQDGYDMKLLILGGILDQQYAETLKALSKKLEIDNKIIWTGMLDSKEISVLLHCVDICVSINCPRGIALNSGSFHAAAIHGLPIITNGSRYLPENLKNKDNIILISPYCEKKLKKAITFLYDSEERREKIGQNIKIYSKDFTWEKIAQKINVILKSSSN